MGVEKTEPEPEAPDHPDDPDHSLGDGPGSEMTQNITETGMQHGRVNTCRHCRARGRGAAGARWDIFSVGCRFCDDAIETCFSWNT
jgi:hypothetical protein